MPRFPAHPLLSLLVLVAACSADRAPTSTSGPPPRRPGADDLADEWPQILPGVESRQFSSFDRGGGNNDGFAGTYSTLYRDANGEHVIVDALGPGRLNTLWFTSGENGHARLDLGEIRLYLDDEPLPRLAAEANAFFAGRAPGFPAELVFNNARSTGGFVSWVPVLFARRLRITTTKTPFFYSAQYDVFPVDKPVASWDPHQSAPAAISGPPAGNGSTQPWTTLAAPVTHTGAGTIEGIRFTPDHPPSKESLHETRLQITWDGDATPAVDVPLDMFFGSGLGETKVAAVAFTMNAGVYENRFPMPYWSGFTLAIGGPVTGQLDLQIGPARFQPGRAGHFHAAYSEARPTRSGEDFMYLSFDGAGKLVGTVLTVQPGDAAAVKGWWEGDLRSYADGRRTPGIHGTGHEDDHFGGWSNEFLDGPFSLPMHGLPRTEILDRNGQYNGNATMYRLWPGIPFLNGIRHSVEHGPDNSRSLTYASVTFFYAAASRLAASDRLDVCDDAARTAHALQADGESTPAMLTSAFEGADATALTLCHRTQGSASFTLAVAPDNQGVALRRVFDQSVGQQRAAITVDGMPVGEMYTAESNAIRRLAERDLFIPGRFTAGKSAVVIGVQPAPGAPAWDVASYQTWSVLPP